MPDLSAVARVILSARVKVATSRLENAVARVVPIPFGKETLEISNVVHVSNFCKAAFAATYLTEQDACRRVAGTKFPDIYGPRDPTSCGAATVRVEDTRYCGCPEFTEDIWALDAEDYSCGARITWLLENESTTYPTEEDACKLVAGNQFPEICGTKCNPDTCIPSLGPPRCECPSCNEDALGVLADRYTCEVRIPYQLDIGIISGE
jgi:hypothetical protein